MPRNALHDAAAEGRLDDLRGLLDGGLHDVGGHDEWNAGGTVLQEAASNGHADCIRLLLEAKADVNGRDALQWTALHKAARMGHAECVRLLLDRGADIDTRTVRQQTALHWAAVQSHVDVARLLLDRGADVDARDDRQSTALHCAVYEGHVDCLRLLVERGADLEAVNEAGQTPRQWATAALADYFFPNSFTERYRSGLVSRATVQALDKAVRAHKVRRATLVRCAEQGLAVTAADLGYDGDEDAAALTAVADVSFLWADRVVLRTGAAAWQQQQRGSQSRLFGACCGSLTSRARHRQQPCLWSAVVLALDVWEASVVRVACSGVDDVAGLVLAYVAASDDGDADGN